MPIKCMWEGGVKVEGGAGNRIQGDQVAPHPRRNYRPTWALKQTEPVAGNYYPVNTRIYIEVNSSPTLLLPTPASVSLGDWFTAPCLVLALPPPGRAHAADSADRPLPGGQQPDRRLTGAHGEPGPSPIQARRQPPVPTRRLRGTLPWPRGHEGCFCPRSLLVRPAKWRALTAVCGFPSDP